MILYPHDVVYFPHLSYFQKLAMCQSDEVSQYLRCRSCLVCHNLLPWVDHQVAVPSSHHECVDISTWSASHCWMMMLGRGGRCCRGENGCVWRCWDGAMMCHVISPEKTGNDCFPVNLWCEVFNVWQLYSCTDQVTGRGTSCVTWSQSLRGTWGVAVTWFFHWPIIIMVWDVCHSICVRMWLFMMISSTS